jgi:hypothetical protein
LYCYLYHKYKDEIKSHPERISNYKIFPEMKDEFLQGKKTSNDLIELSNYLKQDIQLYGYIKYNEKNKDGIDFEYCKFFPIIDTVVLMEDKGEKAYSSKDEKMKLLLIEQYDFEKTVNVVLQM